jgi:hypothetical protein
MAARGLLLLSSALVAACATAAADPDAVRTAPIPIPDSDASGLAAWVGEMCDSRAQSRTECRATAVVRIAEERDIEAAMAVVERIDATDGEGHVLTHMVGIRGFRGAETVGESFAQCTPIHQSGCYHGVIQAYFAELSRAEGPRGVTTGRLDALCAPYSGPDGDRWLRFQCLHGIGHGVMLVHENHLPRALQACDLLTDAWDREVCYGGAFMENVMTVVAPHHDHVGGMAAGDHDDHAAHAGHTAHVEHTEHTEHTEHAGHGQPAVAAPFAALDPDDLHYPCSVLDGRYQMACYDMQTSAMLHFLEGDVAAVAAACREAPGATLRAVCHRSLGRDINAVTNGVPQRSAALCARAAAEDRPSCHTGVAKNLIDVTANAAAGLAYCQLVPEGPESQACYRAIGEQTAMLMPEHADRARFCDTLDGPRREACAAGAGLAGRSMTPPARSSEPQ